MFEYTVTKDETLGLYEGTVTVEVPRITVSRFKADKSDLKYDLRRAVSEIVEEYIEKNLDD